MNTNKNNLNNQDVEERKRVSEKWEKLGFTRDLHGVLDENISSLYESVDRVIIHKANK